MTKILVFQEDECLLNDPSAARPYTWLSQYLGIDLESAKSEYDRLEKENPSIQKADCFIWQFVLNSFTFEVVETSEGISIYQLT